MTQESAKPRPVPQPDTLTAPYWEAAREGKLVIQQCQQCGYYNHPPKPVCDSCLSEDLRYEQVSGKGSIYTYTIMHGRNVQGFEDKVPYANIVVELDERPGLWIMANLVDAPCSEAAIGKRVEVTFEETDEGIRLPQFRLVQEST